MKAYEIRGKILTPLRTISKGSVAWEGDRVTYVGAARGRDGGATTVDVKGTYVVPGFVDLHVHGGGGHDTMEGSEEALDAISSTHARGGTTSLLATTLTAPMERIEQALQVVEAFVRERQGETTVVGAHVEGPYFHPSQAGAQNPEYLKEPSPEEYMPLLDRFPCIRRFSAASELNGALRLGRELRSRGILASVAHTSATYSQILEAIDSGYSHVTHLYSAMSTVRRENAYRISGVVEAALLTDSLSVEVIADGHHLPPSLLKLVIKSKAISSVCAVTDAIAAAGLGAGEYEVGGLEIVVGDDVIDEYECHLPSGSCVARLKDGSAFAGSVALMSGVLQNLVSLAELPLSKALTMITTTPCRLMGWNDRGILAPGMRADMVVLDEAFNVMMTIAGGRVVYRA